MASNQNKEEQKISIVVAIGNGSAHRRVIGKDNTLLWHIPEDLKRFKSLTVGHPVIMGRKTFDSIIRILGKALPDRTNIVITRDATWSYPDTVVAHSLEEALAYAKKIDAEEVFVIGGGQIYEQALPFVDRLYVTLVDDDQDGDSYFPEYESQFTKKTFEEAHEHKSLHYTWINLERG